MRKALAAAVAVAVLFTCGAAMAYEPKVWDDLSWWATSGATPDPVQDPVRKGYWWWPTTPQSNAGDAELWGNRGVVYYALYEPGPKEVEVTPPPPPPPPPATHAVPELSHVLFDFDKAVLKPEGKQEADKVVSFMKQWEKDTVLVEGHTDAIGSDEYNMALGQRRADAVANYLKESGIDAARVSTKSFGESQPAVPNDTPANRKLNRRAVFVITINN